MQRLDLGGLRGASEKSYKTELTQGSAVRKVGPKKRQKGGSGKEFPRKARCWGSEKNSTHRREL